MDYLSRQGKPRYQEEAIYADQKRLVVAFLKALSAPLSNALTGDGYAKNSYD